MKINKKLFYEQLKGYANEFKRTLPIRLCLDIENTTFQMLVEENRNSTMKFDGKFVIQIYDIYKRGMHRYVCDDIYIDLYKEKIRTDYQFYKFLNSLIDKYVKEN